MFLIDGRSHRDVHAANDEEVFARNIYFIKSAEK